MNKLKGLAVTFRCNNNKNLIISNQVSNHFMITLGSTNEGYTTVTVPKEEFMQAIITLANEMHIEEGEANE
nr:MAG TPA: hypothetical protein [Bacteriophage sp.]